MTTAAPSQDYRIDEPKPGNVVQEIPFELRFKDTELFVSALNNVVETHTRSRDARPAPEILTRFIRIGDLEEPNECVEALKQHANFLWASKETTGWWLSCFEELTEADRRLYKEKNLETDERRLLEAVEGSSCLSPPAKSRSTNDGSGRKSATTVRWKKSWKR